MPTDISTSKQYQSGEPWTRALVDLGKARTTLTVPLAKDDEVLGVLGFFRQEVRPFSDKQIRTFADQAVIAIENARLITETREALDEQTATAEVLQVINSSPGDLAPVFDAMLDKAVRLCEAAFGILLTYDGEFFRAVALHGVPPAYAEFLHAPMRVGPQNGLGRLLAGERLIHIADITADEAYRSGDPLRVATADLGGSRTHLVVPLIKDDALLGAIVAYRQEVRPFNDKQIALLENFAAQAVIAMENARLITETRESLEKQTATAEILRVISRSPTDLQPTFDAIAASATILSGAESGAVCRFDGSLIHFVAHHGMPPDVLEAMQRSFPCPPGRQSTTTRAILTREVVHIPDVAADPEFALLAIVQTGWHTALAVPILQDGNPVGAITVIRQQVEPFSEAQIELLKTFADQAVIAIENVRLFNETREALDQQTATAEVLQVINSSPGDLAPVFDAILKKAHSLCGVTRGSLELYDGQIFRAVATHGLADSFADQLRQGYPAAANPATRPLIEGQPFTHILDVTQHEFPLTRSAVDALSAHTLLCVPLRRDDKLLGMIASSRQEVRPFTDKQIALLQNFAAQAVIAMENARLITETREALEQQTATAEVLGVINSSPRDLAPVFDAMLEKAMRLCEAAFGLMFTIEDESAHIVAERDMPKEFSDYLRAQPPSIDTGSFFGRAVLERSILHTADLAAGEFYRQRTPLSVASVDLGGVRALLMAPLVKDNAALGVFAIFRREARPFSEKQIALLQNFAAQAVIAMENARLITETREALEQQTATAEVLQVINSSPGNLTPVFDALLEKATKLCEASFGVLSRSHGVWIATGALPE